MKCKIQREIQNPRAVFTSTGTPATFGTCPECGTKIFRMGRTPAHDGLEPDEQTIYSGTSARAKLSGKPKMVIVESPAKARTVGRFLGKGYRVRASVGHVRDLPANRMGVDIEHDFEPRYVVPAKRKDVVRQLRSDLKKSSELYLATDPDREGEAISWHLIQALRTAIGPRPVRRVEFHEITRDAIDHSFSNPRDVDMQMVDAQQARRILDRLVGYSLSPLLRQKLGRRGLSAGRVQSVAVRLVVEREREIEGFVPAEYWSIEAELAKQNHDADDKSTFMAKLHKIRGQKVDLGDKAATDSVVAELEQSEYEVHSVKEGQRRRNPSPPFTTSTMQQEAARRLRLTARRTMRVAQQLYEGIDFGEGATGLITYMRTDSTNVAAQAQAEAREYIIEQFGKTFIPRQPPKYRTKAKRAQEAHEAIRPTSVKRTPLSLKPYLDRGQYRLYQLIWRRFVASQMSAAVYDTVAVEILAGLPEPENSTLPSSSKDHKPYLFRASGSTLRFQGFLSVYEEARDADQKDEQEEKREAIPALSVGELLDLIRLLPEQHFTQPPPRYSEATLVRALEEYGIGRPSTYAPIISTILQRGYVERKAGRLRPTETGTTVTDLLVKYFPRYIDVSFTAQMETSLDQIARGERHWVPMLKDFYVPFAATLDQAQREMPTTSMNSKPTGEMCPRCGHPLLYKYGRYGKFIGCSNFPECRYSAQIVTKTGAKCPECGGDLIEKHTRKGRVFYGCANYRKDDPESCQFTLWKRPLAQACPNCGGLLVEAKKGLAKCTACDEEFDLSDLPEAEPLAQPA